MALNGVFEKREIGEENFNTFTVITIHFLVVSEQYQFDYLQKDKLTNSIGIVSGLARPCTKPIKFWIDVDIIGNKNIECELIRLTEAICGVEIEDVDDSVVPYFIAWNISLVTNFKIIALSYSNNGVMDTGEELNSK
ncbi:hypothetical protein Lal_00006652 [Lupinus albus]|nr:hypothetical protein Lal_00006652 [Lupinus albus]